MEYKPYTIQDVDWAWKRLLERIGRLSDDTPVPVFVEAQSPEAAFEHMPSIAIDLRAMIPDLDRYEGWRTMDAGYTRDRGGNPLQEIRISQPEHYILQYRISTLARTPMHDRELMLKVGAFLTPRPQLWLETVDPNLFLDAAQQHSPAISSRVIFEDLTRIANDQKFYEKAWFYLVHVSIPHPEAVGRSNVAKSLEWQTGGDMTAPPGGNGSSGVVLEVSRGEADPAAFNESNLPVDISAESGMIPVKVRVTDTED